SFLHCRLIGDVALKTKRRCAKSRRHLLCRQPRFRSIYIKNNGHTSHFRDRLHMGSPEQSCPTGYNDHPTSQIELGAHPAWIVLTMTAHVASVPAFSDLGRAIQ